MSRRRSDRPSANVSPPMPFRPLLAPVAALSVGAAPVCAQDAGEDWDFGRDASRDLVIAAVTFDNFGVAVRCLDDTLSVVVSGVQAAEGEQQIRFAMGDEDESDTTWIGAPGGRSLFSLWPASVAAKLMKGGRLSLGVSDGERTRRLAVDLPSSPAAIGQVFSACGRALPTPQSDEPDGENLQGLRWRSVPQPTFPSRTAAESGIAALSCNTDQAGAPRDCRVESEFPEGGGFGRAAVVAAHRSGRVTPAEGASNEIGGRRIAFVVRYGLVEPSLTTPSRIPRLPRATSVPPDQD